MTADARNNAKSCENRDLIFTRTKTVDAFDRRCPQQCETLRNCERTNFHKGLPGEAGPTVIGRWLALPPLTLARCRCWCCLAWRVRLCWREGCCGTADVGLTSAAPLITLNRQTQEELGKRARVQKICAGGRHRLYSLQILWRWKSRG